MGRKKTNGATKVTGFQKILLAGIVTMTWSMVVLVAQHEWLLAIGAVVMGRIMIDELAKNK